MNEGSGLATGAMHGEGVADGGLHQEAVQHRSVVAVVVEAVGEAWIAIGGFGVGAPDDALVQICDPNLVVFVVVEEEQLIQRLGHVIDASGASRMQDFLFKPTAIGLGYLHLQVALGNGRSTMGSIAIDAHGAEVHQMNFLTAFNDGGQQVMGAVL